MQTIGEQIKGIRESFGMTQEQLAMRTGLSQSMIADIENGRRSNMGMETLNKLAMGLDCFYVSHLIPKRNIETALEERSFEVANKIISASSGSMAIEMQLPEKTAIDAQVRTLQKELLEKHKAALWQKI